jgi:hypothetical protein
MPIVTALAMITIMHRRRTHLMAAAALPLLPLWPQRH